MKLLVINEAVLDRLRELGIKMNPDAGGQVQTVETAFGPMNIVVNNRIPDNEILGVNQDQIRAYNERYGQ